LWSVVIAIIATIGFGLSFTISFLKRDWQFLINGSIITGCCLAIVATYFTAYFSIKELLWKFGLIDLVLPIFGIMALIMIPLTKEIIRAGWKLMTRQSQHEVNIKPREAIEVLRKHIEKQYQEGWLTSSDYEELLQQLISIRNAVEEYDWT
jgi:hypothetical protein